jgi:excisionase family DNA binding protein
MEEAKIILSEIKAIKQSLASIERNGSTIGGWLPKKAVLRYFDYSDNQLRMLEKENALEVSKIGRRKFYSAKSITALLEKNKQEVDSWFNLDELRDYLPDKPSISTVYGWVNGGNIPAHKVGKKLRFLKSDIDNWLKDGRKKT